MEGFSILDELLRMVSLFEEVYFRGPLGDMLTL